MKWNLYKIFYYSLHKWYAIVFYIFKLVHLKNMNIHREVGILESKTGQIGHTH